MTFLVPDRWMKVGERLACGIVLLAVLWLAPVSASSAETLRGVALVIGNGAYEHITTLPNPVNDARAVEKLLSDLGFETTMVADRNVKQLSRALEGFIEDAKGADVAVVYYSGHGIEAGGENFLVPVDADLSALAAAGEKLVPVSAFIRQLQATVPLVIVMLDACRDTPFPPGSLVRLDASADPAPMGEAGLGATRGAVRLTRSQPGVESIGTVLGFAAEPGKVALDGDPGGNSPYAAAVLRHLDAMAAGEEFGMVMRMIGEEVYLKTAGRQRPWVNESLRRLLYFGRAPDPVAGEEGELLAERRQLLVTIAELPDPELRRRQAERIAADGGLPLDAVYGMLRALGTEVPRDPAELEKLLRAETERFAKVLAEREIINSPDAEIMRLTALADRAEQEGLLSSADSFRERAKARYLELEPTLEEQEQALRQRFIEGAAVFARSAETKALAFDHLAAALDYAEAFRRVENRDRYLAWQYMNAMMVVLTDHGYYRGDNAALELAIVAGGKAVALISRERLKLDWAPTQENLGSALWRLGERESGTARLEQAVFAYRAALEDYTREREPLEWAQAQIHLGNGLWTLGQRQRDTARLEEAAAAYRAALEEYTREHEPFQWAVTQNALGVALSTLGERESGTARLEEAVIAHRAALEVWTRETAPFEWAVAQNNLGTVLRVLGKLEGGTARLEEAVVASRAALEEWTRERLPLLWAAAQNNLGDALQMLGRRESGTAKLEEAVAVYGAALEERLRERVPLDWARTQISLGAALSSLGARESGTARLEQAVAAYRAALEESTRERVPLDWATTQNNLGDVLIEIGRRTGRRADVEEGRQAIANAWGVHRDAGYRQYDDDFRKRIEAADALLATME